MLLAQLQGVETTRFAASHIFRLPTVPPRTPRSVITEDATKDANRFVVNRNKSNRLAMAGAVRQILRLFDPKDMGDEAFHLPRRSAVSSGAAILEDKVSSSSHGLDIRVGGEIVLRHRHGCIIPNLERVVKAETSRAYFRPAKRSHW